VRLLRLPLAIPFLALGVGCADSGGPNLDGPSFFQTTFDGAAWAPDTVAGIFFYTQPDTGTLNLFATRVVGTVTENLALSVRLPLPSRTLVLADTGTVAVGSYSRIDLAAPSPPFRPPLFTSTATNPGTLRITAFRAADSVIAGSFSFVAATTPDTAGHHTTAGTFRVHYETQQVFIPLQ
jgi:hypothetical protein